MSSFLISWMSVATGILFFMAFYLATMWRRGENELPRFYTCIVTGFATIAAVLVDECYISMLHVDFPKWAWVLMVISFITMYGIYAIYNKDFREHHLPKFMLNWFLPEHIRKHSTDTD